MQTAMRANTLTYRGHIAFVDGTEPFHNRNAYGPAIQPPCAGVYIRVEVQAITLLYKIPANHTSWWGEQRGGLGESSTLIH